MHRFIEAAKTLLAILIFCALVAGVLIATQTEAHAQTSPTLTFTPKTVTGNGSVIPDFSWSTQPAATSCTASGAWSGTKAASGVETLSPIVSGKSYTLTCTWLTGASTLLKWTPPTLNTDGTTLTDLKGYGLYYGTPATGMSQFQSITNPAATSYTIDNLTPGTWSFFLRAVGGFGEGSSSTTATRIVPAGTSAEKKITISVNPLPLPPTNLTAD